MSKNPGHQVFDRLKRLASKYDPDSEDFRAIELAAFALHFIGGRGYGDSFREMLAGSGTECSGKEQTAFFDVATSSRDYFRTN